MEKLTVYKCKSMGDIIVPRSPTLKATAIPVLDRLASDSKHAFSLMGLGRGLPALPRIVATWRNELVASWIWASVEDF